jgi:hypothetical protein
MRFDPIEPPRRYEVGWGERFDISDCGRVHLDPDEQVTFVTEAGGELDVTRKDWGFYATPSLNARLSGFGLRAVLVRNRINRFFVLLVEDGKDAEFARYLELEDLALVTWLDSDEALRRLEERLAGA